MRGIDEAEMLRLVRVFRNMVRKLDNVACEMHFILEDNTPA